MTINSCTNNYRDIAYIPETYNVSSDPFQYDCIQKQLLNPSLQGQEEEGEEGEGERETMYISLLLRISL